MKSYKLLDIETNRVFVLRDFVFHQNIFPLLNSYFPISDVLHLFDKKVLPLPFPYDDLDESEFFKSFGTYMPGTEDLDDVAGEINDLYVVTHSTR